MRAFYCYKREEINHETGKVSAPEWMTKKRWLEEYEERVAAFSDELKECRMDVKNCCGYVLLKDGTLWSYTRIKIGEN